MEETQSTVAVYAAPDELTAQMMRGALEANGIPAVIGEQVAGAYAPMLQLAEGFWGEVHVRPEDEARARALIAALDQGADAATDEELTAQAEAAAGDPGV